MASTAKTGLKNAYLPDYYALIFFLYEKLIKNYPEIAINFIF